jgi:hypothetical protein
METDLKKILTERKPAYNSTLAIGGVPSPLDSFVVAESSVLRINLCAEKPAHRQSAKRYVQPMTTTQQTKISVKRTLKTNNDDRL